MNNQPEPCVGIFWLFKGRLIVDSTPLGQAEPDGNTLTHAKSHREHWTALQEQGVLPIEVEYDEPPRGRVQYMPKKKRFLMLADECIIQNRAAVQRIIAALYLPDDTEMLSDSDYRCSKCLQRR